MTAADLIAALSALPPDTPVGVATGRAVVPVGLILDRLRAPHPGWEAESGLAAVGFELDTPAARYHEERGGGMIDAVRVVAE